ncbi:MAG: hypothetical protein ACI9R3_002537 [Verrucomicrobiales bacterium]|jgi:hypothetical protein
MNRAAIVYAQPVSLAMERTKRILFQPFSIAKWFALGFTAWLAQLLEGGCSISSNFKTNNFGGGNGNGNGGGGDFSFNGWEDVRFQAERALDSIRDQLSWIIPAVIILLVIAIVVGLAMLWVSSRGKFMFLDNVALDQSLVKQPWHQFRMQGNSLFWWRLLFNCFVIVGFMVLIGGSGFALVSTFDGNTLMPGWIAGAVAAVTACVLAGIATVYIAFLLEDFVVPIMYKHSLPILAAWRRVIALHSDRPGAIFLYALFRFVLVVASFLLIFILVIGTCCIGGILFAVPYIGVVAFLPIYVFFRALSLEFLRQFGPDYDVWEGTDSGPLNSPSLP